MKTEFDLSGKHNFIEIWPTTIHNVKPNLRVVIDNTTAILADRKQMELLAVNILKVLKSKHLTTTRQ